MTWKAVTRFDQLKVGDTVRFKHRTEVTGLYRGDMHAMAVVYVTHEALKGAPRDVLCKLKELELKESDADAGQKS